MDKLKSSKIIRAKRASLPVDSITGRPGAAARGLLWSRDDYYPQKFRIELYRFLRDNIPLLNACIWTWSRLSSAPGRFELIGNIPEGQQVEAQDYLDQLALRLHSHRGRKMGGLESFLPFFFSSLYTDGAFCGFVIISPDCGGIDYFQPIDPSYIVRVSDKRGDYLVLKTETGDIRIEGDDFYYFGLNIDIQKGLGNSILSAVPFVAYIEQQLVDDMRRSSHNAGYHRLHVKITPPEKMAGETDESFVGRINEYFDETVEMIKDCEPEDNPVTWDNVKVEYIGPTNITGVGNTWFLNHRAMVEEICSGTNLAPFMLGYSYGTTHNWAQLKYDLVMRQVISVQRQTARFLEWLGNMELALKNIDARCRFIFDNTFTYLASDRAEIGKTRVDNLIKLFAAGLISKDAAIGAAGDLL
jgi:hypothetical protein